MLALTFTRILTRGQPLGPAVAVVCCIIQKRLDLHICHRVSRDFATVGQLVGLRGEWQTLMAFVTKSPTPSEQPPTLSKAMRATAKLGGFIGRKSDGEPGFKVLWRGLMRLQDIVETWTLTHPIQDVGNA